MKIKDTYEVSIPSEDGEVVLTFRKVPLNTALDMREKIAKLEKGSPESDRETYRFIFSNLIEVKGLEKSDGKPASAEDIRELRLDIDSLILIMRAHNAHLNPPEAEQKKDSPSA